ncbi:HAD domain-containing protein [Paraburkholderia sp. CNPSo 3076]|uniref:HAD domain-containing protein n=1 Tax=Paraburkholderia sp. CNPSo 3076 TaxID=2940936 RepID=UPI002254EAB6|nr:HAD domain-containing protein [Paraburkholderia sp. CNPSo 3076]MCX5543868.1 HAD domain-containing protein [Paraburkholderia sp. CNPSo 3076]
MATDLKGIGQLIRSRRHAWEFDLLYASELVDVPVGALSRLEDGLSVETVDLLKVLNDFGLAMLVLPKDDAVTAMAAVGHTYEPVWKAQPESSVVRHLKAIPLVLNNITPTLFLDFDGTLHIGHSYLGDDGEITLDTGRPLLEFAPLLADLLEPYPAVEIVLTTSWIKTLPVGVVGSYLPPSLALRVVGSTRDVKPRLSYVLDGTDRTYVISSFALGKGLRHWLALDDAAHGAYHFGPEPGSLVNHFLLLDGAQGISDVSAQRRIREWLADVHAAREA